YWPSALVRGPAAVERVVARALSMAPVPRYQRARSFAVALQRLAAGKPPEDPDETVPLSIPVASAGAQGSEAETEFWNEVKDSKDPEDIKLYIEQFPAGAFIEQARRRVAELSGKKS
ncbi:MAG: hypothetical protein ACT4P3_12980, partial [Betaproteobacteria bacterium]